MSVALSCAALIAVLPPSNTGLPEAAKKLTLRQAFHVSSAGNQWFTDLAAAKARSVSSGLPMVLHFEAKWCGACQTMSKQVLSGEKVVGRLGRRVVGVKIDADHHPHLIRQFHIAVLPSDVYLDSDGRILAQESGYRDEPTYLAALDKVGEASSGAVEWMNNPNVKLGKEAHAVAGRTNCVITRRAGVVVGLGGYSPVTMTRSMGWDKGNRNYASIYQGVMYYMKDAKELKEFEASPEKFAPKLHGCDPVVLSNLGTPLPGAITLGAFVEGNLYFFATKASRDLFKKNPGQFIKSGLAVKGDQLQDACCAPTSNQ
ncbi:MAG: thioredoxin family protein [Planctomycetaceae bacterium]